ncbi:MAG: cupin-like domain-containing protein [Planctomycetota bacterium]
MTDSAARSSPRPAPEPAADGSARVGDPRRWLGEVDRRRGLTPEEFWNEYHLPRKPVVLEGLMDDWRAMEEWSIEFFRTACADDEVPVGRCFGPKEQRKLGSYIDSMHELADTRGEGPEGKPPLYMEGWYYLHQRPDLADYYSVPEHFGPDWFYSGSWPFKLDPKPWALLVGPKGAFTKLHHDLWATHSWNAQIVGRKRWIFVAPDHIDDIYLETRQSGGYVAGTDVERPDLERFPRLAHVPYTTAVVNPGEMIWFPSMWFHEVESLDDSVSITHNYVSGNIYFRVLGRYLAHRFLKKQSI